MQFSTIQWLIRLSVTTFKVMSVNFQFNRGFVLERGGCGLNNAKGTGV